MGNVAIVIETFLRSLIWLLIPGERGREILMLRKELQVLKRHVKRPRFKGSDRLFFVALLKLSRPTIHRLITIKPATILKWHGQLAARKWNFSTRRVGRPPVEEKIRLLVIEM